MKENIGALAIAVGVVLCGAAWAVSEQLDPPVDYGKCGTSEQSMQLCGQIVAAGFGRGNRTNVEGWRKEQALANFANRHLQWDDIREDGTLSIFNRNSRQLKVLISSAGAASFEAIMPATVGAIPAGAKFTGLIDYAETIEEKTEHGTVIYRYINLCAQSLTAEGRHLVPQKKDECLLMGSYISSDYKFDPGLRAEWYVSPDIFAELTDDPV